ncbi:MAG: endonuclease dU [Candidatus Odinarchaeia archaeon]
MIKNQIRGIGIDDCPFDLKRDKHTYLLGVIYRGNNILVNVLKTEIEIDGLEATDKISNMIRNSKYYDQLRVIFLSGVTFGGFNIVNIKELYAKLEIPVIVIMDREPDFQSIKSALKNLSYPDLRWSFILNAGQLYSFQNKERRGKIFFQFTGVTYDVAVNLINNFQLKSMIPEPLRVAHIIAKIFK